MSIGVSPSFNSVESGAKPVLQQPDEYLVQQLNQRQALNLQVGTLATRLENLRDRAVAQVQQLTFPTTRDEEWRFTDLSSLQQITFQAPTKQIEVAGSYLNSLVLPEAAHSRLVFVNGTYVPRLSSLANLPSGLLVGHLAELPLAYQDSIQGCLGQHPGSRDVFAVLNTASFIDAAVIWVAKNLVVEQPIHLLFVTTTRESAIIAQPRCLVVAETSSALTLIEEHTTIPAEGTQATSPAYWANSVTEIWLQENAQVNHSRIQREHREAFHVGKTAIAQARDSRYTCNAISLGAKLSRHNLEVTQLGEQTETILNGLTLASGTQLADTHSKIAFSESHGTSQQLHKCIVDDRAHAVFNGKVFVSKAAQLTDAAQLNRNLLLSPKARVDAKPQLEIVADNVKCTHGATVGQLDPEEVFYLQSRGLDRNSACNLLVQAFATEVIERIPVPSLRDVLAASVLTKR